jgi:thiol-disulfide isomerase/thioredoxin
MRHFLSSLRLAALAAPLMVMLGFVPDAQAADQCMASKARVDRIAPLIKGPIAALQVGGHPSDVSGLVFKAEDGTDKSLADFKGKVILLNLWATWCAPCRHEMPDLDALQAALDGETFEVVTVSLDRSAPEKARHFFDKIGVKSLTLYYDKSMKIFNILRGKGMAFGMPTTLVLDADGCALAHMAGPAAWASDEAQSMLKAAME